MFDCRVNWSNNTQCKYPFHLGTKMLSSLPITRAAIASLLVLLMGTFMYLADALTKQLTLFIFKHVKMIDKLRYWHVSSSVKMRVHDFAMQFMPIKRSWIPKNFNSAWHEQLMRTDSTVEKLDYSAHEKCKAHVKAHIKTIRFLFISIFF